MFRRIFILALLVSFFSCSTVKVVNYTDDQLKAALKKHITALASDAYEGRETGLAGEKKAMDYIVREFKSIGLTPKGEKGFIQEFPFTAGAEFGESTQLVVNSTIFEKNTDFYPLPFSGNGVFTGYITKVGYGISDQDLQVDDYKGKVNIAKRIFLIEHGTPDHNNPHGKFSAWTDMRKKIDLAMAKGASAIIFVNSDTAQDDPKADWKMRITPVSIPVLFAKEKARDMLMNSVITNCTVGAEVNKITRTGHNVIGYIDNKGDRTVVIGAHYDHLGYGDEGSLYRGEKAIHNGADDNASGTSGLIEIARYLKSQKLRTNYLFVAFSGEEKGLLGSNYFVKHSTIKLTEVNYMLNMDMIGRLKTEEPVLIINGTGTSPKWKSLLDSLNISGVKNKETESGIGPSDHTSFYLQNIPVLHFFSGTHADYHKPSDDEGKINYAGAMDIVRMIERILVHLDDKEKLAFSKTKDESNEDAPRFKVTLGVVPDYTFEGEGMRIDGVTDGKPASKAGLKPGDIVVQLGEIKVLDMMSYMKALGQFKKGQTTRVKVKRGSEVVEYDITF